MYFDPGWRNISPSPRAVWTFCALSEMCCKDVTRSDLIISSIGESPIYCSVTVQVLLLRYYLVKI